MSSPLVSFVITGVLALGMLSGTSKGSVVFQAEVGQGFDPSAIHSRSQAAGLSAVWLTAADQYVLWTFCLNSENDVTVQEVRFSMDGYEKEVAVFLDQIVVGTFNAHNNSNNGNNWDVFLTTNTIFETLHLQPGNHTLKISLKSYFDIWGVEIDQVTVSFGSGRSLADVSCEKPNDTTATSKTDFAETATTKDAETSTAIATAAETNTTEVNKTSASTNADINDSRATTVTSLPTGATNAFPTTIRGRDGEGKRSDDRDSRKDASSRSGSESAEVTNPTGSTPKQKTTKQRTSFEETEKNDNEKVEKREKGGDK